MRKPRKTTVKLILHPDSILVQYPWQQPVPMSQVWPKGSSREEMLNHSIAYLRRTHDRVIVQGPSMSVAADARIPIFENATLVVFEDNAVHISYK